MSTEIGLVHSAKPRYKACNGEYLFHGPGLRMVMSAKRPPLSEFHLHFVRQSVPRVKSSAQMYTSSRCACAVARQGTDSVISLAINEDW